MLRLYIYYTQIRIHNWRMQIIIKKVLVCFIIVLLHYKIRFRRETLKYSRQIGTTVPKIQKRSKKKNIFPLIIIIINVFWNSWWRIDIKNIITCSETHNDTSIPKMWNNSSVNNRSRRAQTTIRIDNANKRIYNAVDHGKIGVHMYLWTVE